MCVCHVNIHAAHIGNRLLKVAQAEVAGALRGEIAVLQNVHTDAVVAEVYKAVVAARGRICALHVILRQRSVGAFLRHGDLQIEARTAQHGAVFFHGAF